MSTTNMKIKCNKGISKIELYKKIETDPDIYIKC